MEIKIISKEILKPSLPTPNHLRSYKLCVFDQLASPVYIPITLFYSATHENPGKLKESLSNTLTHFYPFAGRLNDDRLTIDCNDAGVVFIEAQVSCDMSFVVEEPQNEVLQQLLPFNPNRQVESSAAAVDDDGGGETVLLGVQVNHFTCGGMAIGVCVSHVIADGSSAASFVKIWAQFACESVSSNMIDVENLIYDSGSRFPPQDLSDFYRVLGPIDEKIYVQLPQEDVVAKRFCFDRYKISALRGELSLHHPTRVEAVTALIWEALIAATSTTTTTVEMNGTRQAPIQVIANAMNLRARLNPPLPQQCIGNVSILNMVSSLDLNMKNTSSLAKKIRESIKVVHDECTREVMYMGSGEWLDGLMGKICEEFEKDSKMGVFYFTSWCRFPFYGTDFGWGKPMWVEGGLKLNRTCILVDSSDGEEIEAWITLSKEEMVKFEQQHGILVYSTFKPSV